MCGLPYIEDVKFSLYSRCETAKLEALDFRKEMFHIEDNALFALFDRIAPLKNGCEPWKTKRRSNLLSSPTVSCFECGSITSDSFCVHTLIAYALWSRLKYYDGPPQPSTCWSFLRHFISFPDQTLARNGASVSGRLSRHRWFGSKRYLERIDYPTTFGPARAVQVDLH